LHFSLYILIRGGYGGVRSKEIEMIEKNYEIVPDADLCGANISFAKGVVCLGTDPRGYHFVGVRHTDGWHIAAGCRWFTVGEA
jgi:hypothetical protein